MVKFIEKDGKRYGINEKLWDGEKYFNCWIVDENDIWINNNEEYEIKPVYKVLALDEDTKETLGCEIIDWIIEKQ